MKGFGLKSLKLNLFSDFFIVNLVIAFTCNYKYNINIINKNRKVTNVEVSNYYRP